MVVKRKVVKKKAVKRTLAKRGKVLRKKTVKVIEADNLFEEAIGSREGLIDDMASQISDVLGSLDIVENGDPDDTDSYKLIQFIGLIKRSIKDIRSKIEKLQYDSLDDKFRGYICIEIDKSNLSDAELSKIKDGTSELGMKYWREKAAPRRWFDWAGMASREIDIAHAAHSPASGSLQNAKRHCSEIQNSINHYRKDLF